MKRKTSSSLLLVPIFLILFAACVNRIDEEEMPGELVSLHVETRAGSISLPYPIHIYAFDAEGKQAAMYTLNSATDACSLSLTEGSYHLVALAGTEGCTLPENPTKTSNITLPASNCSTSALMMGGVDVTLKGADAEANITLAYQMTCVALSLSDIPAAVTAVNVSFSPLYTAINLGRSCTGEGGKATIACAKEGSLWKVPAFHTLPAKGQSLTLSIELITDAKGTKSYGYIYEGEFKAGIPYVLSGSYKQGFNVNGTITAEGWGAAQNISFTFGGGSGSGGSGGETPDPGTDNPYPVTAIPAAGTLWENHLVCAVQNATATSADLLLLSMKEWQDVASALSASKPTEAVTFATTYSEGGITGWNIPTKDEANLIESSCGGTVRLSAVNDLLTPAGGDALTGIGNDSHGEVVRYLCEGASYTYDLKSTSSSNTQAGTERTYYLRAVKTIHVTLSN